MGRRQLACGRLRDSVLTTSRYAQSSLPKVARGDLRGALAFIRDVVTYQPLRAVDDLCFVL